MSNILIQTALLVNEGTALEGDLLIEQGRIARVGGEIPANSARVINAAGKVLMPGMIDTQVHFREPGLTRKGDIASESRAAVSGGITSFFEMPNTIPNATTLEVLEDKFSLAAGRSWGNFAFYLGAANDNIDEIRRLEKYQTCGIKIFMGASTGNMLVDDVKVLEQIFRDAPTVLVTHCEDTPTILENEARFREQYGDEIPMRFHPEIRSAEACFKSSSMAVELAKKYGTRLHVLHLTTEMEMALFQAGDAAQKQITAEACVHHLYFSADDYEEKGSFIKCNPAIKTAADRAALRDALREGRLDVIATDHAPHTLEEKLNKSYFKAPAGLPLVQHALAMAMELVHEGVLGLPQAVARMTHAPAQLFGVKQRGYLREGYWADLALVDLEDSWTVTRENTLYKCGWSPLEGRELRSRVLRTFVNGEEKYREGEFIGNANGRRLEFEARR